MKIISTSHLRTNFHETIDEVHFTKKPVVVARHGKPWVLLTFLDEKDATLNKFIEQHTDAETGKFEKKHINKE